MNACAPYLKDTDSLSLYKDFFKPFKKDSVYTPSVNVSESETEYTIEAEIPGVKEKDISLKFKDGVLSLSAKHEEEKQQEGKEYHKIERRYGSFERSFRFPNGINQDSVSAHYENGILNVTIKKPEETQAKDIQITTS